MYPFPSCLDFYSEVWKVSSRYTSHSGVHSRIRPTLLSSAWKCRKINWFLGLSWTLIFTELAGHILDLHEPPRPGFFSYTHPTVFINDVTVKTVSDPWVMSHPVSVNLLPILKWKLERKEPVIGWALHGHNFLFWRTLGFRVEVPESNLSSATRELRNPLTHGWHHP